MSGLQIETTKYLMLNDGGCIDKGQVGQAISFYEDDDDKTQRGYVARFTEIPQLQGRLFRVPLSAARVVGDGA